MFVGKAMSLPYSGETESCFTRVGTGITLKHKTRLKGLARDKHLANYKSSSIPDNDFYKIATWGQWYKTFLCP
jgi:hypothetical protein